MIYGWNVSPFYTFDHVLFTFPALPQMHWLRLPDPRFRAVLPLARQLLRVRLLLPAEEQGPGLPRLQQGLQALSAEGDDAVRGMQEVRISKNHLKFNDNPKH